jgi:hypothetical protein
MALSAVRPEGDDGRHGAVRIDLPRHDFKMLRVHAGLVTAEMVQLETRRDRATEQDVSQPMRPIAIHPLAIPVVGPPEPPIAAVRHLFDEGRELPRRDGRRKGGHRGPFVSKAKARSHLELLRSPFIYFHAIEYVTSATRARSEYVWWERKSSAFRRLTFGLRCVSVGGML